MYGIKIRYLASVFVDAGSIQPNRENIKGLQQALNDENLLPRTIREGVVSRMAFVTSDGEWQLNLLSNRFDLNHMANMPDGSNLGEFSDFCQEATAKLITTLNYFKRKGHRLAAVQEGLLAEMSNKEMNKIANHLLKFPKPFIQNFPFEWDWRAASQMERSFGQLKEPTNTLVTIKRIAGTISKEGEELQEFNRIRVDFDINTLHENIISRFNETHIADFFEHAASWHKEFSSEIFSFILQGGQINE